MLVSPGNQKYAVIMNIAFISISFNISSIVKLTTELLLNASKILLVFWEKYINDFESVSDVAGVAKSFSVY